MQALLRGRFFSWYPCTVFITTGLCLLVAFKASLLWNKDRNPNFLRMDAAPQPLSSWCQQALHCHDSSGHRWHLQRPHRRSWILLFSKPIGNNGLEHDCDEGEVIAISKVIPRTHSLFLMTWSWELLSKQWRVVFYRKNWKTPIIWIAVTRRSAGSWTSKLNNELSAHTRNAYPLKAMETEKAPSALVNHKLAWSYWCGVTWLSKIQVKFQSVRERNFSRAMGKY